MKLQELLDKYGNIDISEVPVENINTENEINSLRATLEECNDKCWDYLIKNGEIIVGIKYIGNFIMSINREIYFFDKSNRHYEKINPNSIAPLIAYYICDNQYDCDSIDDLIEVICSNVDDMRSEIKYVLNSFEQFINSLT